MKFITTSDRETKLLGQKLRKILCVGDVVIFEGGLGVGKTTFIKGVLRGFGFREKDIISPTFTIIKEYSKSDLKVYHIDLYRIERKKELINLDYQQFFYNPPGVTLIEWGERIEDILPEYIKVRIGFIEFKKRKIIITLKGYPKAKLTELSCYS